MSDMEVNKNPLKNLTDLEIIDLEKRILQYISRSSRLTGLKKKTDFFQKVVSDEKPEFGFALQVIFALAYNDHINFGVSLTPGCSLSDELRKKIEIHAKAPISTSWTLLRFIRALEDPLQDIKTVPIWSIFGYGSSGAWIDAFINDLIPTSANLFVDILERDLKAGFSIKTVEKVFPGLIEPFEVMKAAPFSEKKFSAPSIVEIKYDGMRVLAEITPGAIRLLTRTGRDIPGIYDLFSPHLKKIGESVFQDPDLNRYHGGFILDGEVTSGLDFNETMSSSRKKYTQMKEGCFHVFDVIPIDTLITGEDGMPLDERKKHLALILSKTNTTHIEPPTTVIANSPSEAFQIYQLVRRTKVPGTDKVYEGVIVKNSKGLWRTKRHPDWMKIKACETLDLPIVGYFEGEGKYQDSLGGLIVDHNGVQVHVGSGFRDDERAEIWRSIKISPDDIIGWYLEVEFQEVTNADSLRHPVAVRLRKDKGQAEF